MECKNCNELFTGPFCPFCGTAAGEEKAKSDEEVWRRLDKVERQKRKEKPVYDSEIRFSGKNRVGAVLISIGILLTLLCFLFPVALLVYFLFVDANVVPHPDFFTLIIWIIRYTYMVLASALAVLVLLPTGGFLLASRQNGPMQSVSILAGFSLLSWLMSFMIHINVPGLSQLQDLLFILSMFLTPIAVIRLLVLLWRDLSKTGRRAGVIAASSFVAQLLLAGAQWLFSDFFLARYIEYDDGGGMDLLFIPIYTAVFLSILCSAIFFLSVARKRE
ncbi:MAG: hypothetical protein FWE86_02455 [Oscillospiraceae bacterium]|nr:hypothetical protein [Oscillospiraceae bacterium]